MYFDCFSTNIKINETVLGSYVASFLLGLRQRFQTFSRDLVGVRERVKERETILANTFSYILAWRQHKNTHMEYGFPVRFYFSKLIEINVLI